MQLARSLAFYASATSVLKVALYDNQKSKPVNVGSQILAFSGIAVQHFSSGPVVALEHFAEAILLVFLWSIQRAERIASP